MTNLFQKSLFALALVAGIGFSSCKKEEEAEPSTEGYVELSGDLTTRTLDPTKKYLLKGFVFVQAGQILTIPAGTVIYGDKASKGALVINKGGKIFAEGTAEKPIIFTSKLGPGERDKGDWGGVIILGNANVNQQNTTIEGVSPAVSYGTFNSTANDTESSGVLKYVRIEFAGIALSPNNEINGLTFGGVGSGTVVENVQVSYSGDDAFEWFGGTVNCKNLIALGTWDDDFDTDFGYTGKVQFALAIRDPFNADQSGSNAFESDNDGNGTGASPKTAPVFSNVTILGPRYDSIASISGSYRNAVHTRRNSALSIFNSVITGFPTGILIDGNAAMANYASGQSDIKSNLLISLGKPAIPFASVAPVTTDSVKNYYNANNPAGFFSRSNQVNYPALGLDVNHFFGKNAVYPANPNFAVTSGSISNGADFTHTKLLGQFFSTVTNLGAFGTTDWTDGWSNFDPKGQVYP